MHENKFLMARQKYSHLYLCETNGLTEEIWGTSDLGTVWCNSIIPFEHSKWQLM